MAKVARHRQSVYSDELPLDGISNEVVDAGYRLFLGRCFDVLPTSNPV
ncbi:MAG: hypothetical protein ACYDB2_12145 [Acidimicrobiales bacterium]